MATPLRRLPLDTGRLLRPTVITEGEMKVSRDGEIRKDPDTDKPWWLYGVAVRVEGTRAAAVLTIQTPGEQSGIEVGMLVRLVDLVAAPWEMADGSGITFSASAIVPASAPTNAGGGARTKAGEAA